MVRKKSQPKDIRIRRISGGMLGSWSRGYDVALTWRRSPVQIRPGPPAFPKLSVSDTRIDFLTQVVDRGFPDCDISINVEHQILSRPPELM